MTEGKLLRLRCGGSQRERFYLQCRRECDFEQRAERMKAMASALVRAGKLVEAPIILRKAADQPTEAAFARIEKRCQEICTEAPAPTGPAPLARTFRELGELWTSGALHRKYPHRVGKLKDTTRAQHVRRLAWLYKRIGSVPLMSFTVALADQVMGELPEKQKQTTRLQYAQLIARVLRLAAQPCRLIERSPIEEGWAPKPGPKPAFSFLYPSEDAKLLACPDVPLEMRVLYGFLCREGMRSGEADRLEWADLDLERGVVRLDKNKTDMPRPWKLDPGVCRALSRWQKLGSPTGRVFPNLVPKGAAVTLRAHLRTAGIERPELYERSAERQPFRLHDCRGTFVTISLAHDKTEQWVMDRTGHTTSNQLQGYRRAARFANELELGPLLPLDEALGFAAPFVAGGRAGPVRSRVGHRVGQNRTIQAKQAGQERIEDAFTGLSGPAGAGNLADSRAGTNRKLQGGPRDFVGVGQNEHRPTPSPDEDNDMSANVAESVEMILARALDRASAAEQWETVTALSKELTERRRERAGSAVVEIDSARRKRP